MWVIHVIFLSLLSCDPWEVPTPIFTTKMQRSQALPLFLFSLFLFLFSLLSSLFLFLHVNVCVSCVNVCVLSRAITTPNICHGVWTINLSSVADRLCKCNKLPNCQTYKLSRCREKKKQKKGQHTQQQQK